MLYTVAMLYSRRGTGPSWWARSLLPQAQWSNFDRWVEPSSCRSTDITMTTQSFPLPMWLEIKLHWQSYHKDAELDSQKTISQLVHLIQSLRKSFGSRWEWSQPSIDKWNGILLSLQTVQASCAMASILSTSMPAFPNRELSRCFGEHLHQPQLMGVVIQNIWRISGCGRLTYVNNSILYKVHPCTDI